MSESVRRWEAWKRGEDRVESILSRYETVGDVPQDILAGCLEEARRAANSQEEFFHKV